MQDTSWKIQPGSPSRDFLGNQVRVDPKIGQGTALALHVRSRARSQPAAPNHSSVLITRKNSEIEILPYSLLSLYDHCYWAAD